MFKQKQTTTLLLSASIAVAATQNLAAQCTQPCPANATDTAVAVGIGAFRINPDGSTGTSIGGATVGQCQKIRLRMNLAYTPIGPSGGTVAAYSGGRMVISTTDNVFSQDVTPAGGVPIIGAVSDTVPGGCAAGGTNFFVSLFTSDFDISAHLAEIVNGKISFVATYGPAGTIAYLCPPITNQSAGQTPIQVNVAPPPSCSIAPPSITICAGNTASFTVSGTNGIAPYTFGWSGPNGYTNTGATITINNAQVSNSGTYTATLTDSTGCRSTCTATLVVGPNPTCNITGPVPVCEGTTNVYNSNVSPNDGSVSQQWSISGNGTIIGSTTGSSVTVVAGPSGGGPSYTLVDALRSTTGCLGGCTNTIPVTPCHNGIKVYKQVVCYAAGSCEAFNPDLTTQKFAEGMRVGNNCASFCYRITVTNTGNTTLTNVTVTDNQLNLSTAGCFANPITLGPGGTASCVVPNVTHCSNTTNVVTATGFGPPASTPTPVTSTDTNGVVIVPINVGCTLLVSIDGGPFNSYSTCPTIPVGHSYVIRTVITNNGSYPIDVTATSSTLCFASTNISALAVGGSATIDCPYTCSASSSNNYCVNLSAVASQSLGHVCAFNSSGQPITATSQCCTCVICLGNPQIKVYKQVVCYGAGSCDAFNPDLTTQKFATGMRVGNNCASFCYRITVTNSGNVVLTNVTVIDNVLGPITCVPGTLPVGASASCEIDNVSHCSNTTNIVTATGFGPPGTTPTPVTSTDTNGVVIVPINVSCTLQVSIDGGPFNSYSSCAMVNLGHSYVIRTVIANNGSYPIDVTATSSTLCFTSTNITALAVGGSVTIDCPYTCSAQSSNTYCVNLSAVASQSLGHVCAYNSQGQPITATSQCCTCVRCTGMPRICVTKEVVCELPAGCADNWSHLATGAKTADNSQCPSFCYRITVNNCGQEDLRNVTVVDNVLNLSGCNFPTTLSVGQTVQCVLAGVAHCGDVTNTVTANGVGVVSGIQTNATDTAAVVVLPISISCNATVNGVSDLKVLCDSQPHMLTNAVEVCNTGSLPLSDITIDAPQLVALGCTGVPNIRLSLLPGQCTNVLLCIDLVTCPQACGLAFSNHISITATVDQTLTNVCSWTHNPNNQVVPVTASTECTATFECLPPPNSGCTPGFWKNCTIHWQLTGYSPGQTVGSVFRLGNCCGSLGNVTLIDALSFQGGSGVCGGAQILIHAAVAGLLNASSPELHYAFKAQDLITSVNGALQSCNRDMMVTLGSEIDRDNNAGCNDRNGNGLPCHQLSPTGP